MEEARSLAEKAGAKRAIPLQVGGAFHSPLMEESKEKLKNEIAKTEICSPAIPIIANVNADYLKNPSQIKEALIEQIVNPVLWEDPIKKTQDAGVSVFVEVGPGRVLSGLVRRITPQSTVLNVEDEKSLSNTLEKLKEEE